MVLPDVRCLGAVYVSGCEGVEMSERDVEVGVGSHEGCQFLGHLRGMIKIGVACLCLRGDISAWTEVEGI